MSNDGPLFHKYNLSRTDGKPMGEAFVLELKDPYAKAALTAYADACEGTHPELTADMREQYGLARAPATTPDPAAPDGDELVAAATRARVVLQQIVASPRHKGPLVSGASAASWALGQALSKPRVGEAVLYQYRWFDRYGLQEPSKWDECTKESFDNFLTLRDYETRILYTATPAAIPDGMVVVPREPTAEMIAEGLCAETAELLKPRADQRPKRAIYRAMIQAASAPGGSNG